MPRAGRQGDRRRAHHDDAADSAAVLELDRRSFKSEELSLYGRFDLRYDGKGPAKLLEFNADTPTAAFETGVFQWKWLEDAIARKVLPENADQFNSLHERLIEGWKVIGKGRLVHFAGVRETAEDAGTLAYIEDCARQAGLETKQIEMKDIGKAGRERLRRPRQHADRADVQALPLGMDDARDVRRVAAWRADAIRRAAVEGHPVEQGDPAAALGDVPQSPEPAACLF